MVIYAPAKVNLCLKVLGERPDGYHNIETVFERVALSDRIVLRSLKSNKIKIFCDHPDVSRGKNGLIHRAVSLLKGEFGISRGVEVKIFKRIPVAAGLGGGSSDAASVLAGLNKLWKLSLDLPHLTEFGIRLGADIPFFLKGCAVAIARGRGDEVTPLGWKVKLWHLIISVPTRLLAKEIYDTYSRETHLCLTKKGCVTKILPPKPAYIRLKDSGSFLVNDLERIVLKKAPIVATLKNALKDMGLFSAVSGSGPSIFSLFTERKEAVSAKELLVKRFPLVRKKGWQIFIVPTL